MLQNQDTLASPQYSRFEIKNKLDLFCTLLAYSYLRTLFTMKLYTWRKFRPYRATEPLRKKLRQTRFWLRFCLLGGGKIDNKSDYFTAKTISLLHKFVACVVGFLFALMLAGCQQNEFSPAGGLRTDRQLYSRIE